jgi:hypothetical protein
MAGFTRQCKNPLADLVYKVFKINAETSEVQSMKIREL